MKAKLAFAGLLSAALVAGGYWAGAIQVPPSYAAAPQAVQGTPVQTLPDFTAIVEANKAAVVNITSTGKAQAAANPLEGLDEDSPLYDFFRRFQGQIPQQQMPQQPMPRQGLGSGFIVDANGV